MSSSSEPEKDLHMGHGSTFWSGHLASCQSNSDLRTSNMLYANRIKIWDVDLIIENYNYLLCNQTVSWIKQNNSEINLLLIFKIETK